MAVLVCIFSVMKMNIFLIDVFNGKISSAKCPSFFCCNLGKYFYCFILYHNCLWQNEKWKCYSCLILCNPMGCSSPGSFVHGILQARILEWVVICFSRGTSWARDYTQVSWTASRFFIIWATREAPLTEYSKAKESLCSAL